MKLQIMNLTSNGKNFIWAVRHPKFRGKAFIISSKTGLNNPIKGNLYSKIKLKLFIWYVFRQKNVQTLITTKTGQLARGSSRQWATTSGSARPWVKSPRVSSPIQAYFGQIYFIKFLCSSMGYAIRLNPNTTSVSSLTANVKSCI